MDVGVGANITLVPGSQLRAALQTSWPPSGWKVPMRHTVQLTPADPGAQSSVVVVVDVVVVLVVCKMKRTEDLGQ